MIEVTYKEADEMVMELRKLKDEKRPSVALDMLCERYGRYDRWVAHLLVSRASCPIYKAVPNGIQNNVDFTF